MHIMACTQCTNMWEHTKPCMCVCLASVHDFFDSVYIMLTIIYTNFNQPFCFFFPLLNFVKTTAANNNHTTRNKQARTFDCVFSFFSVYFVFHHDNGMVVSCHIMCINWIVRCIECSDALEWTYNNTFMHGERDSANEQYINISWPDRSVIRTIPCSCLSEPH